MVMVSVERLIDDPREAVGDLLNDECDDTRDRNLGSLGEETVLESLFETVSGSRVGLGERGTGELVAVRGSASGESVRCGIVGSFYCASECDGYEIEMR